MVAIRVIVGLAAVVAGSLALGESRADPVGDRDGDGIADANDRCVDDVGLEPDGCPPQDRDGDGVLDRGDRCVDAPGPRDNAGCPDTDDDEDGVVDRHDRCRGKHGHPALAGCPAPDRDGDGIADPDDRCKRRPETWNGNRDGDGCPDRGAALVALSRGRVSLSRGRVFRSSGKLATRGRQAMDIAASALTAVRARTVRIAISPSRRAARSPDQATRAATLRARAVQAALAKRLPHTTIEIAAPSEARRPGRRWRVELVYN